MDRNFHTDDFERLLREKSDEFRMYPSKRIWHSIYNNIHPGRKWPSVAMSIMLITALLLMGYLNTKNTELYTESVKNTPQQKNIAKTNPTKFSPSELLNYPGSSDRAPFTTTNDKITNTSNKALTTEVVNSGGANDKVATKLLPADIFAIPGQQTISDNNNITSANLNTNADIINTSSQKEIAANSFIQPITSLTELPGVAKIGTGDNAKTASGNGETGGLNELQKTSVNDFTGRVIINDLAINSDGINNKNTAVTIAGGNSAVERNNVGSNKKTVISAGEDKDWIENYALYNRPATKKWANKLSVQIYATPSVVYRSLYSDPNFGNPLYNTTPIAFSSPNENINKAVIQKPSLGFEIGTGIQYSIFKGLKLKAGLQLNYTRYNSEAYQNTHPVATKVTMHDYALNMSYEVYRTTPYSNKSGLEATRLHNETFQISLPVGADLKLIGNENLQWSIGASIQPTYIPAGKSYLISSDRRNYVKETSMLNKWNLNAGFETFISYKADNGITYQLGPQFRTQIFSTNNKQIAVEEKLLNYGLKFGISKTLK